MSPETSLQWRTHSVRKGMDCSFCHEGLVPSKTGGSLTYKPLQTSITNNNTDPIYAIVKHPPPVPTTTCWIIRVPGEGEWWFWVFFTPKFTVNTVLSL